MTKLKKKNSECDKPKNQIVTQLIRLNCDKTQKLKLLQNSETKIVRKNSKIQMVTNLKNSKLKL